MDLDGKVAFVTGAASGIGQRCADRLLEQGARVVAFDQADAGRRSDQQLLSIVADVSDADSVRDATAAGVARFGKLDFAFNCAGITEQRKPLFEQDDDALDRLFAVNVRGMFLSLKYQLRAMIPRRTGSIVNIASVFALTANATFALYGATKHAVAGLTKAAALEAAAHGIRVNAVAPGPIRTPFIGELSDEAERLVAAGIPLGRLGEVDDVAQTMLWLASPAAAFISGAVLPIDGAAHVQLNRGSLPGRTPEQPGGTNRP